MALSRMMLKRHAEKPLKGGDFGGRGRADERSLTTRGGARARAMARLCDPLDDQALRDGLSRPDAILAARHDPGGREPSRHFVQTVKPLARLMGLEIDKRFAKGEESAFLARLLERTGVALVCWAHESIPALVSRLPGAPQTPRMWPDDRFDMIWVFDRLNAGGLSFTQVPQLLAPGDRRDVITL